MDLQIDIPDLDDDTIYNINNEDTSFSTTASDQASRPRPFRGAELNNHSRSGSNTSYGSSNGSRQGGTLMTAGGSSSSGGRLTNAMSNNNVNAASSAFSSFPRKSSFASLKAAIKGQSAHPNQTSANQSSSNPIHDAYPIQLRNPFHSSQSDSKTVIPLENTTRVHSRNDSLVSASSRGKAGGIIPSQSNQFPRQTQQTSVPSEYTPGLNGSNLNEFTSAGPSLPHFPSFPRSYNGNNAPPAKTAYARSMSSRLYQTNTNASNDGLPITAPLSDSYHGRNNGSYQSSILEPQGISSNRIPDSMGGYIDQDEPLLPPQPVFAESWQHARGSSGGGSVAASEDERGAGLGSFDQMFRGNHTPMPSGNSGDHRGYQPSSQPRLFFQSIEDASPGLLPIGVGLEEPVTPSEYAINVLCSRFVILAGVRVRGAMGGVDESDPSLDRTLGPTADPSLDALLDSLARICRKNAKPVTQSLFRWRITLLEEKVDMGEVRGALAGSQAGLNLGVKEIVNVLTRRKILATAYMLARALSHIASEFTPSADGRIGNLDDAYAEELQNGAFALMIDCIREGSTPSRMQLEALEVTTKLLGVLSKTNFIAIGDKFIANLNQCQKTAPSSKEGDPAVETAVLTMRHLQITPYPMELFEEGAEFLEVLAKHFVAAHGTRVKSAFAETLTNLLLPVARSATAELHHPTWIKALDLIAPRAFSMISKPRYWSSAYPLYVAVLCVSPEDRFLQSSSSTTTSSNSQLQSQGWSWFVCLDAGVNKLNKDKTVRKVVLNAAICLLWTYIFRCRESSNTTTKRLETFFRIWFPLNRSTIYPSDVNNLDAHVVLVHLVLYRHFEFGRDLVLEFLRHQSLSGNTLSLQPELLSKQRMTIAIRAILLTLNSYVKSESPPLPLDSHINTDRLGMGDELSESFTYAKPEIEKAQEQFNDLIGKIALLCDHQIGSVTILDEHVHIYKGVSITTAIASQKNSSDEDKLSWCVHYDNRFVAAYNKDHQASMDLLRACFDSWPRCLSSSIPFASVLTCLFKAHFNADNFLSEAASKCLQRIASQRKGGARAVVAGYIRCIFRQEVFCWEKHHNQLLILSKIESSVKVWIEFLNIWFSELKKSQTSFAGQKGWEMEKTSAWPVIDEVEAIGLFLLCSAWRPLRRQAVTVLQIVAKLDEMFVKPSARKGQGVGTEGIEQQEEEPTRVIHLLNMHCSRFENDCDESNNHDYSKEITALGRSRTRKWKRSSLSKETLGDLAGSEKTNELMTWFLVIPRFLRMCLEHFPTTVAVFRSFVTTRILWMDQSVSIAAGNSNRLNTINSTNALKGQFATTGSTPTPNENGTLSAEHSLMAEHWKMYILALCTTTTSIEGQNRSKGEGNSSGSDRVIAAKDLFQKLIPFMASDHARFRDAVISSLGNININLYKTLLETMQTVSSHLVEDFKAARTGARRSRRHEKLRTAVANVIQLTSPHMTKVMSDQGVIFLVLQWIKETFNFLMDKEIKTDWEFHRLRRFFAGVVEEFFNSLHKNLSEAAAERYLTFETKLRMFRLFREWHSYSQAAKDGPAKLANLLASVAEQYREDRHRENVLTLLRNETQLLSFHASSAMAALCQGVITLVGSPAPAPMSGSQLDTETLLEWLRYLFISPAPQNHAVASRALKALLIHNVTNVDLVTKTTNYAFAESEQTTASRSFFAILSDVLIEKREQDIIPLQQILCLGLIKLGHPDSVIRKKAFALLNSINSSNEGHLPSTQAIEGGVSSPLPATYLRAQRDVSTTLAERFPEYKVAMLCEYTLRLPSIDLIRRATTLGLLPEWLHQIELVQQGHDSSSVILPRRATLVLDNLLFLTIKYGDEHNFEIQDMWASLAEGPQFTLNASIVVKFLIQQALYLRSSLFITHAKRAVSCLSHTILAPSLLSELCSYIEPSSMIPVPLELESMSLPDGDLDHLYLADIESLLPPPSRKQTFSPGQVALLFVGELTYEKSYLLYDQLPLLLHVIFMNVDSLSPFTQEQVMAMFEQLLRSLTAEHNISKGSKGITTTTSSSSAQVKHFFAKGTSIFWTHDDIDVDLDASHTPRTMRATILETLSILGTIFPSLNERWGNVALLWATSNPVRHMACRSFQAFRTLLPSINYTMLADMLGRLSNTISDSTRVDNQTFALEILYTLKAVVQSVDLNSIADIERQSKLELLCHVFWMNIACLSTVNEAEFSQSIGLMHILLDRIDLDSGEVIQLLKAKCPDGWEGEIGGLQNLVMRGLKSSNTYQDSFRLLARLAKIKNDQLIDHHDSRLGYLFLAVLPWFMEMTDEPNSDNEALVIGVAEDIATLAAKSNMVDVERVANSIAKKRFRTKDDLIRQAINCCTRAGFLPNHARGVTILLLSLTFNSQEWLQKQTLQILKLFFQSVDTKREDFYSLGSELLMPLLRLLNSDLSLSALEVMEENIILMGSSSNSNDSGTNGDQRSGPSASQIVRMSMQWGNFASNHNSRKPKQRLESTATNQSSNEINSLFGQPEESGWSVSNIQDATTRTRINILSVFKSVELLLDTPPVGEVNFVDDYDADENIFETTMTTSRNEAEEEDSRSIQARSLSASLHATEGQQPINRNQKEQQQQQQQQQPAVDLGDIVNQLHDLSSFFVDDDFDDASFGGNASSMGITKSRSGHTLQSSEDTSSNHEQIAKILSRRAINTFTVLQGGKGSSSSNSIHGSESSLSIESGIFRNGSYSEQRNDDSGNSISPSNSTNATSSTSHHNNNKRGVVWTRKSIFGSKRGNMAAKTTPTPTPTGLPPQAMAPSDYFAMDT